MPLRAGRSIGLAILALAWIEVIPAALRGVSLFQLHVPAQMRALTSDLWRARDPRLQSMDQVVSLNGRPVGHPAEWYQAFAAPPGTAIHLKLSRAGKGIDVELKVERDSWGNLGLGLFILATAAGAVGFWFVADTEGLVWVGLLVTWLLGVSAQHWPLPALPVGLAIPRVLFPWLATAFFWPHSRWWNTAGALLAFLQAIPYLAVLVGGYGSFGVQSGTAVAFLPETIALPARAIFWIGFLQAAARRAKG